MDPPVKTEHAPTSRALRAREWLSRSMITVEAPGWRGTTKAHTCWYVTEEQRSQPGCIGGEGD
jgi:hypothetical protein